MIGRRFCTLIGCFFCELSRAFRIKAESELFRIHSVRLFCTVNNLSLSCLDVEKEEKLRRRPRPDHSELDFSSQSVEFTDSCEREDSRHESEAEHQSTWPPFWSTCPLKSWNWLEMLPETTRNRESFRVIFNWLSETTRNWTNCCRELQSLKAEFFPTSKLFFCPRRRRQQRRRSKRTALSIFKQTGYFHSHKFQKRFQKDYCPMDPSRHFFTRIVTRFLAKIERIFGLFSWLFILIIP